MVKRATIKDIAEQAGVSLGTVHCALAGKAGVGEATRRRILEIARNVDYRPNAVAASLKRKAVRIAAAFPRPTEENRYYFPHVWRGVRDYLQSQRDFNVSLVEVPYRNRLDSREEELSRLLDDGGLDGLLTVGFTDDFGQASLVRFAEAGVPVVLVGDDMPQSGRRCCVQPNYEMDGRILAELLSRQVSADGSILICAGNAAMPSHYLIVAGFDAYMHENGLDNPVYKIHTESFGDEGHLRIARELERQPGVEACVAVNARGSVMLGRALVESGRAGRMIAVGSDLFKENAAFLRDGVFTNLLHKNPYHQAQMAAKILVDCILRDYEPPRGVLFVGSEVVFHSALPMYASGRPAAPAFAWAD